MKAHCGICAACRRSSSTRTERWAASEQAIRLADKTMAIAQRLGHLGAIFLLLLYRAREAVTLADLESLEALGPQMVDICQRGSLPWLYVGHLCLGLVAHWRGDAERAEAELRRAVELEPAGAFSGSSTSILVRHLAHSGRAEEVYGDLPVGTANVAVSRPGKQPWRVGTACSGWSRRCTCAGSGTMLPRFPRS